MGLMLTWDPVMIKLSLWPISLESVSFLFLRVKNQISHSTSEGYGWSNLVPPVVHFWANATQHANNLSNPLLAKRAHLAQYKFL